MQRKRGELVPIGEVVIGDLDGPVPAIRETSPQARHHFTQADQVNQLVSASEADPDLGFMARMMVLCSLPRTNPGNRHSVQARQRPLQAHHVGHRGSQAPLRQPAAPITGLGVHRSGEDRKPRARSGKSLSEFMRTWGSTAATAKHTPGSATKCGGSLTPMSG